MISGMSKQSPFNSKQFKDETKAVIAKSKKRINPRSNDKIKLDRLNLIKKRSSTMKPDSLYKKVLSEQKQQFSQHSSSKLRKV